MLTKSEILIRSIKGHPPPSLRSVPPYNSVQNSKLFRGRVYYYECLCV